MDSDYFGIWLFIIFGRIRVVWSDTRSTILGTLAGTILLFTITINQITKK